MISQDLLLIPKTRHAVKLLATLRAAVYAIVNRCGDVVAASVTVCLSELWNCTMAARSRSRSSLCGLSARRDQPSPADVRPAASVIGHSAISDTSPGCLQV